MDACRRATGSKDAQGPSRVSAPPEMVREWEANRAACPPDQDSPRAEVAAGARAGSGSPLPLGPGTAPHPAPPQADSFIREERLVSKPLK